APHSSQHLYKLSNRANRSFIFRLQHQWLVIRIQGFQGDAVVLPFSVSTGDFFTAVDLQRVLAPRVGIGYTRVPNQKLATLPAAGGDWPEQAVATIRHQWRH